jgi:L-aminopeptidase/D-esterase-like protein
MSDQPRWNLGGSPADVPGFAVGHAVHAGGCTGCTVVLCPPACVGGMSVGGSAAGTRQTDALAPGHLVQEVHAVTFSGGSAFGLDAAGGVAAWLAEAGRGLKAAELTIPVVPTAVIFDLPLCNGDRPHAALGRAACEAAAPGPMARGNTGAGSGATVGKIMGLAQACKGGLGGASLGLGGLVVGALAVVNAFGDVLDENGRIIVGARTAPDSRQFLDSAGLYLRGFKRESFHPTSNTTLAVVATNARLDKLVACKVAALAQQGLVRTIEPVHTTFDGDLVMVLAAGQVEADVNGLGVMAGRLVRLAILDAVRSATSLPGLPAARDLEPQPRTIAASLVEN